MDVSRLHRVSNWEWRLDPEGERRVPAVLYGDEGLIAEMDDKVLEQIGNVACLPGIVDAAYTMPDAHWGYGFPIGGVAGFDPDLGGVVSAGDRWRQTMRQRLLARFQILTLQTRQQGADPAGDVEPDAAG